MRSMRGIATIVVAAGTALGAGAALADNVPLLLGEVGEARADRSAWSQIAEFVSLILDSGWAWAATAVLVGWLVAAGDRPRPGTALVTARVRPRPGTALVAARVRPRPGTALVTAGVHPRAGALPGGGDRPRFAALLGGAAGCAALVVATVAFYVLPPLLPDQSGVGWFQVRYWLVASLVLGLPLGAVGATIRRPGPVGALAALVVPVGAVLNDLVRPLPADSAMAIPVRLTIWAAAAIATILIVARATRRPPIWRRSSTSSGSS